MKSALQIAESDSLAGEPDINTIVYTRHGDHRGYYRYLGPSDKTPMSEFDTVI